LHYCVARRQQKSAPETSLPRAHLQSPPPLAAGHEWHRRSHNQDSHSTLNLVDLSPSSETHWSIARGQRLAAFSPELLIGTLGNPLFSSFRSRPSDLDRLVRIDHLTKQVLDDLVCPDLIKSYGSYLRSTRSGTSKPQSATCHP
jgi:hypothetical protein